jgi:hypothetical protein
MMAMHFLGLILIVGTVGLLDIRIMGFLKQLPVAPLHRLLPWGLAGLGINIATGLMAFAGRPDNYIFSAALWLKILALMLLGVNAVAFYLTGIFGQVKKLEAGEDAPFSAKLRCERIVFVVRGYHHGPVHPTVDRHASWYQLDSSVKSQATRHATTDSAAPCRPASRFFPGA